MRSAPTRELHGDATREQQVERVGVVALVEDVLARAEGLELHRRLDGGGRRGVEAVEERVLAERDRDRRSRQLTRFEERLLAPLERGVGVGEGQGVERGERGPARGGGDVRDDERATRRVQRLRELGEQGAGRRVDRLDALAVEDDRVHRVEVAGDRPEHDAPSTRTTGRRAARRRRPHRRARWQHAVLGGVAHAVRARFVAAVRAPDGRAGGRLGPQEVQQVVARDPLAGTDAAHAVAAGVERRREHADPELTGEHGDDATRDAALGREADRVDPLARVVVHAARVHDTEHVRDVLGRERLLAGDRVGAAVGERRRHHREVAAVDEERALPEVQVEGIVDVTVEHPERPHQVRDRAVAVAGRGLRPQHGVVDVERVTDVALEHRPGALEPLVARRGRRRGRS